MKQHVVTSMVANGNFATVGHVAKEYIGRSKTTAHEWLMTSLADQRTAQIISFRNPGSLGICWDGFRQGKPAKEWFCSAVCLPNKNLNASLPPVAPPLLWCPLQTHV